MKERFSVLGMSCAACSAGIERTLRQLDGVKNVEVSLIGECMNIEYDENRLTRVQIMQSVEGLGYGVSDYNENALVARTPQPNKLKRRFLLSLLFLLPLMYFSISTVC